MTRMTREEAIEQIKDIKRDLCPNLYSNDVEALAMAISALSDSSTKEKETKIRIETIDELLDEYQLATETTFRKKVKRTGLIFQIGKELKCKYKKGDKE